MAYGLQRALAGAAFLMVASAASAASAPGKEALRERLGQSVLSSPGVTLPEDRAMLDKALADRNWAPLAQAASAPGDPDKMMRMLNWERYQVFRGGGYNLSYMYMITLQLAARSYENSAQAKPELRSTAHGLKLAALSQLLYVYAVLEVDGVRCKDPTAPIAHRGQIASFSGPVLSWANDLTKQERIQVVMAAAEQEAQLAPVRDPDPELCHGGLDDMTAAMESDANVTVSGSEPGYPGTNVNVRIDPKRPAAYSDAAQWEARRTQVRQTLPDALGGLVGLERAKS